MEISMRRCLGITRNLHRCGRIGAWRLFCYEHRWQPLVWLSFIVFTVAAGTAQLYSTWWPQTQSDPEILRRQQRLEGLQTGGDSYAYFMLYYFDLQESIARNIVVIRRGEYPLYDVRIRIRDMDAGRDIFERSLGEINAPAIVLKGKWPLTPSIYYRVFFAARNGQWRQDLILKRSEARQYWAAATRVFDKRGKEVVFEYLDNPDFVNEFGAPA
jgi:hypothetical protein